MTFSFPILNKELRTLLRSRKAFIFMFLLLLIGGFSFWAFWQEMAGKMSYSGRGRVAREIYVITTMMQIAILGIISPVMTATCITSERAGRTLDLLFSTCLSRFQIVLGKWISVIAYVLILVLLMLPILGLVFQLGGIGADEYIASGIMVIMTILTYSMIGIAFSAWSRKSTTAMFGALFTILFLGFLLPLSIILLSEIFKLRLNIGSPRAPGQNLFSFFLYSVSPIFAWVTLGERFMQGNSPATGYVLQPEFIRYVITQVIIFFGAAVAAWMGVARAATAHAIKPRILVDDPEILRKRRDNFPYYLIDPLRRPQSIADGQDPLYIKEQRVGTLSKLPMLIRIGYIGVFFSFLMLFPGSSPFHKIGLTSLTFVFLFMPVIAATVISKEREEDTFPLLISTTLQPRQIVWAKFRNIFRLLLVLAAGVMLLPSLVNLFFSNLFFLYPNRQRIDLQAFLRVCLQVSTYVGLYAAVGLYCSSRCRRNLMAIVLAYAIMLLMVLSPFIFYIFAEIGRSFMDGYYGYLWRTLTKGAAQTMSPFISPYATLEGALQNLKHSGDNLLDPYTRWAPAIVQCIGTLCLAAGFLWLAARRVGRIKI